MATWKCRNCEREYGPEHGGCHACKLSRPEPTIGERILAADCLALCARILRAACTDSKQPENGLVQYTIPEQGHNWTWFVDSDKKHVAVLSGGSYQVQRTF